MKSVRKQLLLHLMTALLMTSIVVSIVTYISAREEIDELYDEHLRQIALALEGQKIIIPKTDKDRSSRTKLKGEEEFLIQTWSKNGKLLYSSHPRIDFPAPRHEGFSQQHYNDEAWRSYATASGELSLQVAQPLYARDELLLEIALKMLIPVLLQFPIMALFIWLAVGNSLESLSVISSDIQKRSEKSLQPLDLDSAPEEVVPMVNALNELLSKLTKSIHMQRRFTADAAHELRTPLTAVKLQLALLGRSQNAVERQDALNTLTLGVERSIRLVEQLLTFARIEADVDYKLSSPVDLDAIAHETVRMFSGQAAQAGIDLGLAQAEKVQCHANQDGIQTVLNNLISNALNHTPRNGRIDVSVYTENGRGVLVVADNGTGIDANERIRIFDRFYRIPGQVSSGTGLGLAIVKNILDQQGATIRIDDGIDGRGVSFKIIFPA